MALAGVELETLVSETDALTTRPPPSDTYQEGSSEWRAQKRPSIYRRSRAVIGRQPMGATAKLHAIGSQHQLQLGSFYKYSAFSVLSILTILLDKCQTLSGKALSHVAQGFDAR